MKSISQKDRSKYVSPEVDVIRFSASDIITNSDSNQGEWDPQTVNEQGTIRWGDMQK